MGSASLVLHDVSVTFADDTDSLRARQAPYVCFKLGPKGESSQQTECIKNAGREVVWHQTLAFSKVIAGANTLEVLILDHNKLRRDRILASGHKTIDASTAPDHYRLALTDKSQRPFGDLTFWATLVSADPGAARSCKGLLSSEAKRPEPARLEHLNSHVFLETNWKAQYARLACEVALKEPISVAVISANPHIDTAQWSNRLRSCADGAKVEFYPVPAQRTISVTQKGKEKQLSVKKFVLDKKLAGSTFDAWVYIVGSRAEPAHRSREESKELRHDKALLKGLMKRSRLPLTLIHTTADLGPATCKKALKATKDYNAAVFHLPAEGGVGLNGPGQPLDPLCAYLHPWASPAEAAKATVPCLHARVATNILVRREVDRQLQRHKRPGAATVLWVGVSHTGLGILVPMQPYIGIPLLIAESFTRMFYHVLHVCHTAGIIYNLKEAWAKLKSVITKKQLEGLKRNPKLTKRALKDAGKDGTKAGLEGAAEAIFVEVGVTITKELAHTAAEHVLQEASAIVATQVVEYVLPAIGAIVTVAMLPHTYAKIHRMVTCMAYTYHEQWAFTSSLPLPMVYEALSMNQPDLAVHLQKAMKLEQQQEYDSPDDLISTQWRTLPQYARSSAPAPTYPSREAPTHGSESVHPRAGMSAPGDDSPIDFDTLFLYKSQAVTQAEMDHLEREGPADLIRAFKTKPVSTVMAADGTPVATWPFSNVDHNAHKWGGMTFTEVIGEPPPPEDAFHPDAHVPWCTSPQGDQPPFGGRIPMQHTQSPGASPTAKPSFSSSPPHENGQSSMRGTSGPHLAAAAAAASNQILRGGSPFRYDQVSMSDPAQHDLPAAAQDLLGGSTPSNDQPAGQKAAGTGAASAAAPPLGTFKRRAYPAPPSGQPLVHTEGRARGRTRGSNAMGIPSSSVASPPVAGLDPSSRESSAGGGSIDGQGRSAVLFADTPLNGDPTPSSCAAPAHGSAFHRNPAPPVSPTVQQNRTGPHALQQSSAVSHALPPGSAGSLDVYPPGRPIVASHTGSHLPLPSHFSPTSLYTGSPSTCGNLEHADLDSSSGSASLTQPPASLNQQAPHGLQQSAHVPPKVLQPSSEAFARHSQSSGVSEHAPTWAQSTEANPTSHPPVGLQAAGGLPYPPSPLQHSAADVLGEHPPPAYQGFGAAAVATQASLQQTMPSSWHGLNAATPLIGMSLGQQTPGMHPFAMSGGDAQPAQPAPKAHADQHKPDHSTSSWPAPLV
ncbi:hypothetical protein WJX74_009745 [Apatococcus lobatus]|uniref:C2 domain-containing protein n=1 Tax=Apatococcus lobatus TaxID=904363 RepID=A0AAW1RWJ1_9CHLO